MNDQYLILSLDGGGIRGVYSAVILSRLIERFPKLKFDLHAGTSTGGILALALASGLEANEIVDMYRNHGPTIFKKSWTRLFKGPKYGNEGLKTALTTVFGSATLGQIRDPVLIPAFDLSSEKERPVRWKPKFFDNVVRANAHWKVVDVALATSAAPTYFPAHKGFIDGGVVCNNPSVSAISFARHLGVPGDRIKLISIGTGVLPKHIPGSPSWGLVGWLPEIVDLLLGGGARVANYQARQDLKNRFMRINTKLDCNVPLDSVESIDKLVSIAEHQDLSDVFAWCEAELGLR